jgi:class 3 adenylate cyclase
VGVYRIEQTHRIRAFSDQYIVVTDLRGFGPMVEASPMGRIERILDYLLELMRRVCAEFSGTHRSTTGDSYVLTFPDAALAMAAVDRLAEQWNAFQHQEPERCSLNIAVHKGVLYAFRGFLLSADLNLTANVEAATKRLEASDTSIFVTGHVRKDLAGTAWDERFSPVDAGLRYPRLAELGIYRLAPPGT